MDRFVKTFFSAFGIGSPVSKAKLGEVSDRRSAPRFMTNLVVRWPNGSGVVRDISSTGVRFETEDRLPSDEKMKFTIVIPDETGGKSHYALCDSEIHWRETKPDQPHKLNIGASFTMFKSIGLPLAA
jgi:hypothetical protein